MSEQSWIFLFGIGMAIIAYLSKNFILQPMLEFREVKGRIQNRLKYNANKYYSDDVDVIKNVTEEFRQLSCDLEEKYYGISFHKILSTLYLLPSPETISQTAVNLLYISNSTGIKDRDVTKGRSDATNSIKSNLKLI